MRSRLVALAVVSACAVAVSAQSSLNPKFDAERGRLDHQAAAARAAKKLDEESLNRQYPPTALQPVPVKKIVPGGSAAIALAGIIPAGVTVLSERDGAVLSGATISRSSFAARITVGAGEGPGFVKLYAITPVSSAATPVAVAFIDAIYRFDLKASDGLVVKIFPTEKTFVLSNEDRDARLQYQAEFYKPGEAKPFETRTASMLYMQSQVQQTGLDVSVGDPPQVNSPEQEMNAIAKQLEEPTLPQARRDALTQQFAKAQQRMIEAMLKGATVEAAAAADKKRDSFGCHRIQIAPGANGSASGTALCGKNFYKGVLQLTGTIVPVR